MEVHEFKDQIFLQLRKINENMEWLFRPAYDAYGLTWMQVRILLNLEKHGEVSISALSKTMGCAMGNVSTLCRKLEKEGFVNRVRDKKDERIVRVKLTEGGIAAIQGINESLQQKYANCLNALTKENLDTIVTGLTLLNTLFYEMGRQTKQKNENQEEGTL